MSPTLSSTRAKGMARSQANASSLYTAEDLCGTRWIRRSEVLVHQCSCLAARETSNMTKPWSLEPALDMKGHTTKCRLPRHFMMMGGKGCAQLSARAAALSENCIIYILSTIKTRVANAHVNWDYEVNPKFDMIITCKMRKVQQRNPRLFTAKICQQAFQAASFFYQPQRKKIYHG